MENNTKATPNEHSNVVGGSSAGRVINCPGSVKLNQAVARDHKQRILMAVVDQHGLSPNLDLDHLPDEIARLVENIYREETTSPYAAEGTGLHEAMAWILDNDEEPESVVDRTFEGILITSELYADCVVPALQGFDDYCERVYEEDGEEMEFLIEERCQIPGIDGAFGTSDIIGKTSKRMVIWDWKFGAGVMVLPFQNDQLRFYGRAAAHTKRDWLGFSDGLFPSDLKVDLIISQPRIGDGQPQVWETTYGDLEEFRERLVKAVAEALGDDPQVTRGDHCKWCEAKHICPAKQQLGQRILERVDNAANAAPAGASVSTALSVQDTGFTPAQLSDWLEDAKDMEAWIKWVREVAFKELEAGREVDGYELDQGLGNAAWTEDEKTVDKRLASYGLLADQRRASKPISPTVARKLLKDDPKKAKLIEKIIHRPPGPLKMVAAGTAKNPVRQVSEKVAALGEKLEQLT